MKIYVYSKCSTCKDALRFLNHLGIKADVIEITDTPPSIEELQKMLDYQNNHLKKLFNVSGNLYREMGLSTKLEQMSNVEALELLSMHGMLVKRPFLLADDFGCVGFKESEWTDKLNTHQR